MAPRYSIVAGDFAEDPRADVSHFRVYLVIGRHTDKAGWCRLKQITIGERVGLSRETVNRKLKDLCGWGYVERGKQDAAGRAYYYRTIMDRGAPPVGEPDDDNEEDQNTPESGAMRHSHGSEGENSNVRRASHDDYNSSSGITSGVSAADHSRCEGTPSHHNDLFSTALPNGKKDSPPQPPAGGRVRARKFNETEAALRELEAELTAHPDRRVVLDNVIGPIVTQRKLDAPVIASALRSLVKWVSDQGISGAEAPLVVQKVLAERRSSVKPSDITDTVKRVVGNRPSERVLLGDPVLMRSWPIVIADLERRLGVEQARMAFSTFVIDRLVSGRGDRVVAYIATHEQWRKKSVELSLSAQFRAALCEAFPKITDVFIEVRRKAA